MCLLILSLTLTNANYDLSELYLLSIFAIVRSSAALILNKKYIEVPLIDVLSRAVC